MRRLHPIAREVDPSAVYGDLQFPSPIDRPYVALNFVTSLDGRVAVDGRASGLGSASDRAVMRQLRARADALLVGAGTVRAEPIDPRVPQELSDARVARGRPPQPLLVLLSASANLPDRKLFHLPGVPVVILTVRVADVGQLKEVAPAAEVVVLGESWIDPAEVVGYLHSRGVESIVCEGGPVVAGELVAAGLVDEVFLTVAPRLVGGASPRLLEGPLAAAGLDVRLALLSAFEQDGELFLRYRIGRE